jgi:nitrite reductase (NADH) large subunit
MTTGVRPAITLAQASGIPCARGIVVDGQLRSAVAGVSALGECCEIAGQTWGLVAPCLQQAEILAARLLGTPEADFHWQAGGLRLKVTGIDLFSAGDVQARDGDDIWTSLDPSAAITVACWCGKTDCAAYCCWAIVPVRLHSPND